MALRESQQILEAVKRSSRPLICVPRGAGADGYAAAIGLAHALEKLERRADIVAADGETPKTLRFLNGQERVRPALENMRRFVIELDATKATVDELAYELKDGKLRIFLAPKTGSWEEKDVSFTAGGYRYDLIICLGAADLESCGHLYEAHPDFFYRVPIINVDHRPENEHFGHINAVDLTAVATSEACHDLIESIEPGLVDEEAATAFLAGMIARTKSFRTRNVTPKTLQTASKLVARGARRDDIVRHLYRTRSVPTLRLWGRALARLKSDASAQAVWTMLSRQDFLHAGAEDADLPDVVDELIASSPDAKVVALLYESRDQGVVGVLRAERPFDLLALAAPLKPVGTRDEARVSFPGKTIVEAEREWIGCVGKNEPKGPEEPREPKDVE